MPASLAQRVMFSPHSISGGEFLVLITLAWFSDRDGRVKALDIRSISKLARLSEKQVKVVLRRLRSIGVVVIEPGGGRGRCATYTIDIAKFRYDKRIVLSKGGVQETFYGFWLKELNARVQKAQKDTFSAGSSLTEKAIPESLQTTGRLRRSEKLIESASLRRRKSRDRERLLEQSIREFASELIARTSQARPVVPHWRTPPPW